MPRHATPTPKPVLVVVNFRPDVHNQIMARATGRGITKTALIRSAVNKMLYLDESPELVEQDPGLSAILRFL